MRANTDVVMQLIVENMILPKSYNSHLSHFTVKFQCKMI